MTSEKRLNRYFAGVSSVNYYSLPATIKTPSLRGSQLIEHKGTSSEKRGALPFEFLVILSAWSPTVIRCDQGRLTVTEPEVAEPPEVEIVTVKV